MIEVMNTRMGALVGPRVLWRWSVSMFAFHIGGYHVPFVAQITIFQEVPLKYLEDGIVQQDGRSECSKERLVILNDILGAHGVLESQIQIVSA